MDMTATDGCPATAAETTGAPPLDPAAERADRKLLDFTLARWRLVGGELPPMTRALRLGELARQAAMAWAGRMFGEADVPAALSGHMPDHRSGHRHLFYLPEDADGDGRIDHLIIHGRLGLSPSAICAVAAIALRLDPQSGPLHLAGLRLGRGASGEAAGGLGGPARCWVSASPYFMPWHVKKGHGCAQQVHKECRVRGLPAPEVVTFGVLPCNGRRYRPADFDHVRHTDEGIRAAPDRYGQFLRLEFLEAVSGPLALGFGCHYGLGLFRPDPDANGDTDERERG